MSTEARRYGKADTRRRILDAAWRLVEEGNGQLTLADVAGAAGVSRQGLYLHFQDRARLFVALVDHIDTSLGSARLRSHISDAPTGLEALRRWIETMSWYTAEIDAVTRVLEWGQHDEALAAAWRDRMGRRRDQILRPLVERMAEEGDLAEGWSVDAAADLVYVVTMPGPWRELTHQLAWGPEEYAAHVFALLARGLAQGIDERH